MYDPNETCSICGKLLSPSPYRRYRNRCGCSRNIYTSPRSKTIIYT